MSDSKTTLDSVLDGQSDDKGLPVDAKNQDQFDAEAFIAEKIGEGKQYASAEEALKALAKGKFHADSFIETLKIEVEAERKEKERLEAQLGDAKKIDDLLAAIESENAINANSQNDGTDDSAQIDVTQIKSLVSEMLEAEKAAERSKAKETTILANEEKAFDLLARPVSEGGFGSKENATLALRKYINDDDARRDIIKRMAGHTPEAVAEFLQLQLKGDESFKMDGVGSSDVRVAENHKPTSGMLTWKKVQQVKKEDPKLYWSTKFQMQIHEAAAQNPDFWN